MFDSLLVANRGEIACRVFRTARQMGIRTIAVYSEADRHAVHVSAADEALCIGPAPALQSYLDIDKVIDAAMKSGAQAIHPGYGFLSENAEFASRCAAAGIVFVGPPAHAIEVMGSKMASKQLMQEAGVPVLPGYHGDDQTPEILRREADRVGYPLLIKASAGGGGKGMRLVENADDFVAQLEGAKRESLAAFGDDAVLLERYLTAPKHIEVQLMADQHGCVVHLFERDCSVQRRHQKVIEEAPGPTVTDALRQQLGTTAVMAAEKVGYEGAGTVEFIAEGDEFYFMEMNTRLQVEHPVTEAVTGLDLVEWQLRVAAGEPLPLDQTQIQLQGHAIEVRLYAENPRKKFLPSTGHIEHFFVPADIRTDSGITSGSEVTMHYDPMLAKLIAVADNRDAAIRKLAQALACTEVAGVEHNLGYLSGLLRHPLFLAGDYTTGIAEQVHDSVTAVDVTDYALLAAQFVLQGNQDDDLWCAGNGFRLNQPAHRCVQLRQGKVNYSVELLDDIEAGHRVNGEVVAQSMASRAHVIRRGTTLYVMYAGHTERFIELTDDSSRFQAAHASRAGVVSPMPGQVIEVLCQQGDKVATGEVLMIVEAMKMEHKITAPKSGTVAQVFAQPGERVDEGVELVKFD
ncbi:MAG: acetyl/propionyl/methylcrotonyl-CoA carboxylase subunit alpha [Pseudomonadota bacterium]